MSYEGFRLGCVVQYAPSDQGALDSAVSQFQHAIEQDEAIQGRFAYTRNEQEVHQCSWNDDLILDHIVQQPYWAAFRSVLNATASIADVDFVSVRWQYHGGARDDPKISPGARWKQILTDPG